MGVLFLWVKIEFFFFFDFRIVIFEFLCLCFWFFLGFFIVGYFYRLFYIGVFLGGFEESLVSIWIWKYIYKYVDNVYRKIRKGKRVLGLFIF